MLETINSVGVETGAGIQDPTSPGVLLTCTYHDVFGVLVINHEIISVT